MGSIGDTTTLPSRDSPSIHLDLLTQREWDEQTAGNSVEWSGALNKQQYLEREAFLANQEMTRDGRLTAWGLVHQPNGVENRLVLAGCETYCKKGLVRTGGDGKVEEGVIHGVGSVFCPPQFRGQGYAGRMMRDLGERLRTWQVGYEKEAVASVLFSDIGKKFYAKNGWQAFPSAHVSLSPKEGAESGLPEVKLLRAEDLPALCEKDEKLVRQRMEKQKGDGKPAVALIPDIATIRWHHAREEFIAKANFGKEPQIKGAVAGKEGERVWCYWNRVFTNPDKEPPVLHILRLVLEDQNFSDFEPVSSSSSAQLEKLAQTPTVKAIAAVFDAARQQAQEWRMKQVMMWNPTATTLAAVRLLEGREKEVEVVQREEESIASLLWYGAGRWEDVEWVCNEKYGWC